MNATHVPQQSGLLSELAVTDRALKCFPLVFLHVQVIALQTEIAFATQRAGVRHCFPVVIGHVSF